MSRTEESVLHKAKDTSHHGSPGGGGQCGKRKRFTIFSERRRKDHRESAQHEDHCKD